MCQILPTDTCYVCIVRVFTTNHISGQRGNLVELSSTMHGEGRRKAEGTKGGPAEGLAGRVEDTNLDVRLRIEP